MKKILFWFAKKQTSGGNGESPQQPNKKIHAGLGDNIREIKEATGDSSDVVIREFSFGVKKSIDAALVFIDGLVDVKIINESVIKPILLGCGSEEVPVSFREDYITYIKEAVLSVSEVADITEMNDVFDGFLSGDVILFVDGLEKALIINSKGWEKRAIAEPSTESVLRGPKESFIENLRTNTSLLRRKIKNPSLTFETMVLGKKTKTTVCVAYLKGVVKKELLDTVKKRIAAIDTDSILDTGYIEQYIEDAPASIFATIGYTEKPDVVAAKLLEGRVAIFADGSPYVLTAPFLFVESFQTAEDYYTRPYLASFLRIIRVIAFTTTVLAPAIYVAITTYHQELIPTNLLFTMAAAREGIPFPAFVEAAIMMVTFEILREAGIRLPRPIGQALSIVGALVIGEAAVSAGLIGAPMVIVVAITAVSGFVVPNQTDSASVLRIVLLILGAAMGGYGITLGLLSTLVHMAALESFGYPYLSPTVPFDLEDSKDALIRAPLWTMISRPKGMSDDRQRKKLMIPPAGETNDDSEGISK